MNVDFHLKTRGYAEDYELYRIGKNPFTDPLTEGEKPKWAKKKTDLTKQ